MVVAVSAVKIVKKEIKKNLEIKRMLQQYET